MSLTLVSGPAVAPITVTAAKQHLRVDHVDDDDLIEALIGAATALIDGRDGILGRALVEQTWELRLDNFPCSPSFHTRARGIKIPLPPLIEIVSIEYVDDAGALQTLDSSVYQVVAGGFGPALVVEASGQTWPSTRDEPDAVRVTFKAGYAAATMDSPPVAGAGIPASVIAALKLLVGNWYENREQVLVDLREPPTELPWGVRQLLAPLRVGGLGA